MNSARACWLHRSRVYHRYGGDDWIRGDWLMRAMCGVLLSCRRFRCQEGTEHQARLLGLRPCGRCWRRTDADERAV